MAEQVAISDCTTVIGGDVVIKGEVHVEKGLRIDGQIEGSIHTKGKVLIGKTGQVQAEINAGMVVIEGKVTGNITATDRVLIDGSGQVFGDLTAPKLVVNEGATFVGKLNVGGEVAENNHRTREATAKVVEIPMAVSARMSSAALAGAGNGNGNGKG